MKPDGKVDYEALVKDPAWNVFLIDCLEISLVWLREIKSNTTKITVFSTLNLKERTVFMLQLQELLYNHLCIVFKCYPTSSPELKQVSS